MNRTLLLVASALFLVAIVMTATFRTLVLTRLYEIDARVTRLQARLDPVRPVDVLCGVSEQIQALAQTMQSHCQTVHDVSIAPIPFPPACLHPPAWVKEAE